MRPSVQARLYLPYIAPEHWDARSWRGIYYHVNKRLNRVVVDLKASGKEHLFRIIKVSNEQLGAESKKGPQPLSDTASCQPDPLLVQEADAGDRFRNLRWKHAGYQITSYSRMKIASGADHGDVPLGREEQNDEPAPASVATVLSKEELPGGTATGLMLHEILEQVPFGSFAAEPNLENWRTEEEVAVVIDAAMARNAVDLVHRADVEKMVHLALTMEIPTSRGASIPGFCGCEKQLREMEFLFPDPEDGHPPLSETVPGADEARISLFQSAK